MPNFTPIANLRGLSAYQVAVANGFIGTEAQWLDSLKGDITPEAQEALTETLDARDEAVSARNEAETFAAQTETLQKTAVQLSTYVISAETAAVDPSGVNDSGPALIAAVAAAPDGAPIRVEKGVYRVAGTESITNGSKSVFDIDWSGSTVLIDGGTQPLITLTGSYDAAVNVSSLSVGETNTGQSEALTPSVTLTLETSPAWVRGDQLFIVAENELPGSRSPDFTVLGSGTADGTTVSLDTAPATPLAVGHAVRVTGGGFTTSRDYYITAVQSPTQFSAATSLSASPVVTSPAATVTVSRATAVPRVGDSLEVWSVAGNTVTALGSLWGSFTVGPRVARKRRDRGVVRNVTIDLSEARQSSPSNVLSYQRLMNADLENVRILRAAGPAVVFSGCRNWTARDITVEYDRNDQANGFLGYGVAAVASRNGLLRGGRFGSLRHGYTDDVIYTSPGADLWRYGGPAYNDIELFAENCSSAALDTHHGSRSTRASVRAVSCGGALQFRGFDHVGDLVVAEDCVVDVAVFEENAGRNGETANITLDKIISRRNRKTVLSVSKRGTDNWNAGTRETRPDFVADIDAFDPRGFIVDAPRSTIVFGGSVNVVLRSQLTASQRLFQSNNSDFLGTGTFYINTLAMAGLASGLTAFSVSGTGSIDVSGKIVLDNITGVPSVLSSGSSSSAFIKIGDVKSRTIGGLTAMSGTFSTESYVNYREDNVSGRSSGWFSVSSAHDQASSYLQIGRTTDRQILLSVSGLGTGSDVVAGAIPNARVVGTHLTVSNTSTVRGFIVAGVTVPPSSTRELVYLSNGWVQAN